MLWWKTSVESQILLPILKYVSVDSWVILFISETFSRAGPHDISGRKIQLLKNCCLYVPSLCQLFSFSACFHLMYLWYRPPGDISSNKRWWSQMQYCISSLEIMWAWPAQFLLLNKLQVLRLSLMHFKLFWKLIHEPMLTENNSANQAILLMLTSFLIKSFPLAGGTHWHVKYFDIKAGFPQKKRQWSSCDWLHK